MRDRQICGGGLGIRKRVANVTLGTIVVLGLMGAIPIGSTAVGATTGPLSITTTSLPGGIVGQAYSTALVAAGGNPQYSWKVTSGKLPKGIKLSKAGSLTGTPSANSVTGTFTVQVLDTKVGVPKTQGAATASFTITIPVTITALTGGQFHSCALISDGSVFCWGEGTYGELGDGNSSSSTSPVAVSGLAGATAISAGDRHSCAVVSKGAVECWGDNTNGQLGNGTTTSSPVPVEVSGITGAKAVALGGNDSCALLTGGTVDCWGSNYKGQLGNGNTADSATPVSVRPVVTAPPGTTKLTGATALTQNGDHACAIVGGKTAVCWGDNLVGDLGIGSWGSSSYSPIPVAVHVLTKTIGIAAAVDDHDSCALRTGGTVYCWGNNFDGTSSPTPVLMGGFSGITGIAVGGGTVCGLQSAGTVECMGVNLFGELGNGTHTNSPTPVPVTGLSGVASITSGWEHTCALLTGGTVVECWGHNGLGQLGNASSDGLTAQPVVGLP